MNPYAPTVDSFGVVSDSAKYLLNDIPEEIRLKARQDAIDKMSAGLNHQKMEAGQMELAAKRMELADAQRKQDNYSALKQLEAGFKTPKQVDNYASYTPEALAYDQMPPAARAFAEADAAPSSAVMQGKRDLALANAPTTIPYSEDEKNAARQDLMKERGMIDELKKYGDLEDITSKVADREAKQLAALQKGLESGYDPQMLAAQAKQQGMSDAIVEAVRNTKYDPLYKVTRIPTEGGEVLMTPGKDGAISFFQVKHDKEIKTAGEPYEMSIGGKKALVQKYSDGSVKPVLQDTSTTVRVDARPALQIVPNAFDENGNPLTFNRRSGDVGVARNKTGVNVATAKADNKADTSSVQAQTKMKDSMGSFVKNIDKQVSRFEERAKKIGSSDARLLNIPIRLVSERIAGSPDRAIINMYLEEISAETGKLASGATGSVAELSQGAREKWEKIHDPNLSMNDLIKLLRETRHAGQMRMQSVDEQLNETKKRIGKGAKPAAAPISSGRFKVEVM